jgi:hypothetical protein
LLLGGSTADHYRDLLEERKDKPCTPEEQAGGAKEEERINHHGSQR